MVVFSIGITLSEIELLEFVSRVVDLHELSFTDNCLGFSEFLAIIAFIITVSFLKYYCSVTTKFIISFTLSAIHIK